MLIIIYYEKYLYIFVNDYSFLNFKNIFMASINTKKIKLQPKYRQLSCGQKIVPWLNLSGVWLEELGFKVGDTLNITIREKLLIIEPLEGEAKEDQDYKAALNEVKRTLKKLVH